MEPLKDKREQSPRVKPPKDKGTVPKRRINALIRHRRTVPTQATTYTSVLDVVENGIGQHAGQIGD